MFFLVCFLRNTVLGIICFVNILNVEESALPGKHLDRIEALHVQSCCTMQLLVEGLYRSALVDLLILTL